ncbi:MAG: flagellar basal body P-ring formation chaperone FlgA [Halieaceae bacterium]
MNHTVPKAFYLSALLFAATLAGGAQAASQNLAEIAQAAQAHAAKQARELRFKNVQAQAHQLDTRLSLAECGHKLQTFSAPGKGAGRSTVGVRCTSPTPWTIYVPVTVNASVQTVSLRQAMPRGSVLSDSDLQLVMEPARSIRGEYIGSIAAASGKQLRRDTRAAKPLYLNMLTDPNAIERGQSTLLLSSSNNIVVKMNGTALSNGVAGETIKVRNTTSGKTVEGVVMADGSVRIP